MENNKYSFWKLLKKYLIEIPIIQRDYAQGREEETNIRKNFLEAIHKKLVEDKDNPPMNLDFVYGEIKNEKLLTPLDGQQRLTTLFLLHWYLATKENKSEKASANLQNFTYKTRISSREFCKALTTNQLDLLDIDNFIDEKDKKLSKLIEDKNWFFKSWEKDPTIKSMLNMLDAIHDKFKGNDDLFDKLICENNPPITFDFLPLNKFNLTEELYIKMNARGKPLTLFENFKAEFEKYVEDNEIKSKLDSGWLDIFWDKYKDNLKEKELETLKRIDDSYFNFFNNLTLFFIIKKKNGNGEYEIKSISDFDIFKYKYSSEDIKQIERILDSIKIECFLDMFKKIRKELDIFSDFLKPYEKTGVEKSISYEERMRFYIYFKLSILDKTDEKNTKSIIRVCINIINNTVYNNLNDFRNSINQIDILFENYTSTNEFLKDYNPQYNISEQLKEEKEKAILILEELNWEEEILIAEQNWYLNGQIGFLLKLSKNIDEFKKNRDNFIALWNLVKEDKTKQLIQRALLTYEKNYTTLNSREDMKKYSLLSFETGLREKNENWRRFFKDELFKKLIDDLDFSNLENSMKNIINSFEFDCNKWQSFIINPNQNWDILNEIKNGHFQIKGNNILLNQGDTGATSWGWSRVAELKNFYTYKYLKEKFDNKNLELKYHSSSEVEDVCFYFDINFNDKNLAIDIKYDTLEDKFVLRSFYRNPHVEKDLKDLDFKICVNGKLSNFDNLIKEIFAYLDSLNQNGI